MGYCFCPKFWIFWKTVTQSLCPFSDCSHRLFLVDVFLLVAESLTVAPFSLSIFSLNSLLCLLFLFYSCLFILSLNCSFACLFSFIFNLCLLFSSFFLFLCFFQLFVLVLGLLLPTVCFSFGSVLSLSLNFLTPSADEPGLFCFALDLEAKGSVTIN